MKINKLAISLIGALAFSGLNAAATWTLNVDSTSQINSSSGTKTVIGNSTVGAGPALTSNITALTLDATALATPFHN